MTTAHSHHIVVVDDERDIRDTVQEYLELQGYRITPAAGGETLRRVVAADDVDLVLLDLNMPGEDGLSLTRFLREQTDVAIIMLTAAGEAIDRVAGLETGADDYMTKPVDLREMLARIRAVLRRGSAGMATGEPSRQVPFGACRLDLEAHKLLDAAGQEIRITAMEFDLLKAFAEHPNRVLNRDQLLELAHHRSWEPFDRSIDIRIARLRRKVEKDSTKPQAIKTVRGAGYMFVPDGD